jgi:hypothetical protein
MDAVSHQTMGGRDATGHVAVEIATGEKKIRCRQYGDCNARAGQSPRGSFQLVRRKRGEFRHMADRDPAAPLVVIGKPANLVEIEVCRVEAKIKMKIDIDVEATGEIEDAADLPMRVLVHVGGASHHVRTALQGLDHDVFATGIIEQSLLRKHA